MRVTTLKWASQPHSDCHYQNLHLRYFEVWSETLCVHTETPAPQLHTAHAQRTGYHNITLFSLRPLWVLRVISGLWVVLGFPYFILGHRLFVGQSQDFLLGHFGYLGHFGSKKKFIKKILKATTTKILTIYHLTVPSTYMYCTCKRFYYNCNQIFL